MAKAERICETCQRSFWVKPYRAVPGPKLARFCSGSCRAKWVTSLPHVQQRNRAPKPYMIGNQLRAGMRPANAFSPGPRGPLVDREEYRCEFCAEPFALVPWKVRQRGGNPRFCGRECFEMSGCFQGAGSPTYAGGPTTIRGENWRQIRAGVVEEQGGSCNDCGKHVGPSLPVHHIVPFRLFATAEEANQRQNLVGLCARCHMIADRLVDRRLREAAGARLDNGQTFLSDLSKGATIGG